jgi:vitamin B12 transport system substrate-binding protein
MDNKGSTLILWLTACLLLTTNCQSFAQPRSQSASDRTVSTPLRIVSLSPHLTELVYLLGQGEYLVGVSDFSDFPEEASRLPKVASYQGANVAAIVRLQPTHILVWQGGNKDADIAKLSGIGVEVYRSRITSTDSLITNIAQIGDFLGAPDIGKHVTEALRLNIQQLVDTYQGEMRSLVYYLNDTPLMALGNDPWLNDLLSLCGLSNVFSESIAPFAQVSVAQVLRQRPDVLIAANAQAPQFILAKWAAHSQALNAQIIHGNPDKLHRFTPRAIDEITSICKQVYTNANNGSKVNNNDSSDVVN